ncbi:glycosyltransferase [Rhizobium sp. LjRoot254]|uniref:glycosyltransferase n=1 Tax=Rhizobium sp. LjRoot254 TaxID=3342297 RepID=UPI003ECF6FC5
MGDRGRVDYNSAREGPSRDLRLEGKVTSSLSFIQEEKTDEERFLLKLGFSKPFVAAMKARAFQNGTTIETELLASGQVREDAYYGALAKVLGLRFVQEIDAGSVVDSPGLDSQLLKPSILRLSPPMGSPLTLVVPEARDLATWLSRLKSSETLRSALAITTPSVLRHAVWRAGATRRVDTAADQLFDASPELSARSVLTGGQGFLAGFMLMAYLCCLLLFPLATLHVSHVALSSAFCILIVLRALAIKRAPKPKPLASLAEDSNLPVYTVLAALYREKEVVPQLVNSLLRLDWPTSRLDIKLICEAGDRETIDALETMELPPHFEIVEVPDRMPRTKPKALNYGLAGARGEFVVIFDAEDRPHADQLLEAYRHFKDGSPDLACLQAPLIISNAGESWLSALFALEYSGLFRRLLPFLGAHHQPMPLGGTSNHFRGLM